VLIKERVEHAVTSQTECAAPDFPKLDANLDLPGGPQSLGVFSQRILSGPSGPRGMAYLFFCSPARLLRHISRHRERTITIPIMATPSFMPNQMESNVSTVHLSQRVARQLVEMPNLPLNTSIMGASFGKRDGT
jgi:hypothetical protein